ncbi:MAG: AmmeMemoRadiSam system protein B, partial [Nanoarchaeota archaeon]|nr:AmmeMemoRadiSam system protein B [Nanoarchaeota archaeon]
MVRQPAVKGMFYEADEKKLRLEIESCFISKFGPGDLPGKRGSERIIGVLVPHAGYTYSGPCAAWAYKVIAETRLPEAYIILGTDHRGKGSAISIDSWETPLGQILS